MKVQGAAISMNGVNFAIVVVAMDVATNSGEADMAIAAMEPAFGGVPVLLMAQKDDGTPVYYGDQDIVQSLADVPLDKMPWREYSV